jgi:nucleoid-associated protein YgaU
MEKLMGSFQQISLGIICLVAAFAFGTYVNNHPSGSNAPVDAAGNLLDGGSSRIGNVQSRLKLDDMDTVNKRPAPIATMRDPLPPPSQLSGNSTKGSSGKSLSMPNHSQNTTSGFSSGLQVPDFSTIAAEFKNTPIELPPIGAPPSPSSFANRTLPRSSPPTLLNPISIPETSPRGPAQPNQSLLKPVLSNQVQRNQDQPNGNESWNIQPESRLTSDDFAPKLKDRFSSGSALSGPSSPMASAQDPAVNTMARSPAENSQTTSSNQADLPARIASNLTDPTPTTANSEFDTNRTGDSEARSPSTPGANNSQSSERVRAKLPFRLTEESRSELARLRSSADSKIALQTTKFVDHVVQSGETLQSISTRYFGKPDYYLDIYLANRNKLRNPAVVPAGITVKVPMYQ